MLKQTHTHVLLELSPLAFDEIAAKLKAAGYDHAFSEEEPGKLKIDMQGIAVLADASPGQPTRLMVDDLVRSVVINALSGTPLPPEIKGGEVIHATGYSGKQHCAIAEHAQELMKKHNLEEWRAQTEG